MEESAYQHLADAAFRRIEEAFKDVDAEVVDCERAGDVVTLHAQGGKKVRDEHAAADASDLARRQRPRLALHLGRARQDLARRQGADERGREPDRSLRCHVHGGSFASRAARRRRDLA